MSSRRHLRPLFGSALLILLFVPVPGRAQGWVADAAVGRATHEPVPSTAGTTGAQLSLRHEGTSWLSLSAGVPFDDAGPLWGATGLGARFLSGAERAGVGLDVAGHAYGYRDRIHEVSGGGVTLEAMPLLSLGAGPAQLEVRSGLLHHTSAHAGQSASRTLHASDARFTLGSARLQITAEGRYWRAEEGDYPYAGASAQFSSGAADLWGYGGRWFSDVVDGPVWGMGARLRLSAGMEVYATLQQETSDPLYWNAPRQNWSIGLSRRFGRAPAPASAAAIQVAVAGRVTFCLPVSASRTAPAVGGDFNEWNPAPMIRQGEYWVLSLPLAPGVYHYAFRSADGEWFVPDSVPGRTDDGFGGISATVVVP